MLKSVKKILVDADVLVALAKEDDSNHQKSVKISRSLIEANLYITSFTIPEAATVLSHKVSHQAAKLFLKEVREKKLIELPLNLKIEKKTDKIFLNQNKKGISWPDCLNIATIETYKLDAIFSFDKFYQKLGVKIIQN